MQKHGGIKKWEGSSKKAITVCCNLLTDQVGQEQVVYLLSDPGHCQQAADHGGKVLWRAGRSHYIQATQTASWPHTEHHLMS